MYSKSIFWKLKSPKHQKLTTKTIMDSISENPKIANRSFQNTISQNPVQKIQITKKKKEKHNPIKKCLETPTKKHKISRNITKFMQKSQISKEQDAIYQIKENKTESCGERKRTRPLWTPSGLIMMKVCSAMPLSFDVFEFSVRLWVRERKDYGRTSGGEKGIYIRVLMEDAATLTLISRTNILPLALGIIFFTLYFFFYIYIFFDSNVFPSFLFFFLDKFFDGNEFPSFLYIFILIPLYIYSDSLFSIMKYF